MISNVVESKQVQRDCKNGPNLSWLPEFRPFAKKPCRASHPGSRLGHETSFDPWGISRHKAVRSSQNLKPFGPSSLFLLLCFYHTNVLEWTCWGICPMEQNWTAPIIFVTPHLLQLTVRMNVTSQDQKTEEPKSLVHRLTGYLCFFRPLKFCAVSYAALSWQWITDTLNPSVSHIFGKPKIQPQNPKKQNMKIEHGDKI